MRTLSLLIFAAAAASGQPNTAEHWVGTFATAPHGAGFILPAPPALKEIRNQTVRMAVPVTIGGSRARVRLSNAYGKKPLTIGAAHIAIRKEKSAIVPGTDRPLTFGGRPSFTIPPGALALSDPVAIDIPAASDVAISIFIPADTDLSTVHATVPYASYISEAGDFTGAPDLAKSQMARIWLWVQSIEVTTPLNAGALVVFGDSITDGAMSTPDSNGSWPSFLAKRLLAQPGPKLSVLNLGISGNRILHDGAGISALARFDADVLAQTGVKAMILLEGINDIGFPSIRNFPGASGGESSPYAAEEVSAEDIIVGLRQLIDRAHAHGIKVYGGTLTPFEGALYYTPQGEAKRATVNQWIRTGHAFDGVIDFDAAMRDPQHPAKFAQANQSGDNLHPGNAGYKLMADSIDLKMLRK